MNNLAVMYNLRNSDMLDTQYIFFSFKLISEEVNKMDKNLLINELTKYKFNFAIPENEWSGNDILNTEQELVYKKISKEVGRMTKKTLISELIRYKLSFDLFEFYNLREYIN